MKIKRVFLCSFMLVILASTLNAAAFIPLSGNGVIINPVPGNTVGGGGGTWNSNFIIFGFDENQSVTLADPISVDQVIPPTGSFPPFNTPGTINAGETVNSHLFFVRGGGGFSIPNWSAAFKFVNQIIMVGLINNEALLFNSQTELGLTGVNYNYTPSNSVFTESITVSADRTTLEIDLGGAPFLTSQYMLRVITQAESVPIPEPSTYVVMAGMLAVGVLLARRKQPKAAK